MFETIRPPHWPEGLTFSAAVRAGDFIFTSGITATDDNGKLIHEGDIVGQTRAIYANISKILKQAGGTLNDVVETTEFFVPDGNYRNTSEVRRQVFGHKFPAATGIPVSRLIRAGALIEIKVVAYVPNGVSRTW